MYPYSLHQPYIFFQAKQHYPDQDQAIYSKMSLVIIGLTLVGGYGLIKAASK
jgi:hypothetical protein